HRILHEMYTSFFNHYTAQFSAFFKHVMQAQSPLVVHCTAGKDRTGFACAMLLTALGVHDDDILEDYLLTQQCYNVELKAREGVEDRKSTRLNSSHVKISYAVFCLKKKKDADAQKR